MPSSTIDKKIVEMDFDNSRFEHNVNQSIDTLDKLKKSLNLDNAAESFNRVEKQVNSIDFTGLEKSLSHIEHRFSVLGIAGATAISNLTNRAMDKAISSLTSMGNAVFGMAKTGGINRALNLEHANFMLTGLLKDASKVAEIINGPVNNAVSGTAYGLDAAANAAAQFVASGVKDMTKLENALTGISGVAAMTSASYEDIANIFTTVAGQGKVMTMQFRQIEARGLNAAAAIGEYLNKSEAEVRDMVSKGKIDFETFAEAMNKAFGEQAKKANDTFTGAMSNVKAALSRIGAKIATPTLETIRKVFVDLIGVVNNISKVLDPIIYDINLIISKLGEFGQEILESKDFIDVYTNAIELFRNSIAQLILLLNPVKEAFRDVFPAKSLKQIANTLRVLKDVTGTFFLTGENAERLRRIFRGLFSIIDILGQAFGAVLRVLLHYSDPIGSFISNLLEAAATIGDFFNGLRIWIKYNDVFGNALMGLINIILNLKTFVLNSLNEIKQFLSPFFDFVKGGLDRLNTSIESMEGSVTIIDKIKERLSSLSSVGKVLGLAFESVKKVFAAFAPILGNLLSYIGNGIGTLFSGLYEALISGNGFDALTDALNALLTTGFGVAIGKLIEQFISMTARGTTIAENVAFIFKKLAMSLSLFQAKIKADMLASIAKSVGILTLSIIGLSLIDSDKLTKALAAVSVLMGILVAARLALQGFMPAASAAAGTKGILGNFLSMFGDWLKLGAQSMIFIKMATAIGIMTASLVALSLVKSEDLTQALGAFIVMVGSMIVMMKFFAKYSKDFKVGSGELLGMAASLYIIAGALKKLADCDPIGVAVGVGSLVLMLLAISKALSSIKAPEGGSLMATASAITMISLALALLSPALALLSAMDPVGMAVGVGSLAAMLASIGIALSKIQPSKGQDLIQVAASIGLVAIALSVLAPNLALLSAMDPAGLAIGVASLAGMLAAIYVALSNLKGGEDILTTAAAISLIAVAIGMLAPNLALLSAMDPIGMAVAVGSLAVILGTIGVMLAKIDPNGVIKISAAVGIMALAIQVLVPPLISLSLIPWPNLLVGVLGLAGALGVIGAAAFLMQKFKIGPALMEMGKGLLLISGSVALVGAGLFLISTSLGIIGVSGITAAAGLTAIMAAIGAAIPSLLAGVAAGIAAFIVTLGAAAGSIAVAIAEIVTAILNGLRLVYKPLLSLLEELGVGIINLLNSWLGPICDLVISLVDQILIALDNHAESIILHLTHLVVSIIDGLAIALEQYAPQLSDAIIRLLTAVWNLVLVNLLPDVVSVGLDMIGGLMKGITQASAELLKLVVDIIGSILKFFGIDADMVDAGVNAVKGFIDGMASMIQSAIDAAANLGKKIIDGLCDVLKINSPSKIMEWIGEMCDVGAANGIAENSNLPIDAMGNLGDGVINTLDGKLSQAEDVASTRAANIGSIIDEVYKKLHGLTIAQEKSAKSEDQKRADMELARQYQNGTLKLTHQEKTSEETTKKETKSLGGNSKATKKNTEEKKKNEEANDKKTKAINEESEALNEETQEVENNEEAIREQAEQIEVVTEKFDEALNFINMFNGYNGLPKMTRLLSNFWSKGLSTNGFKSVNSVSKSFKSLSKNLTKMPKNLKDVSFAFDSTGKYAGKVSSLIGKSDKTIKNYVDKTGKTLVKVVSDQAKVFEKAGNSVYSYKMRLTKNVKDMGKQIKDFKEFQGSLSTLNYGSVQGLDSAKQFIDILRGIQTYYVKVKDIPENVQAWMWGINNQVLELDSAYNALGRNIGKINGNYLNPQSQVAAYVQDAFISLAATLYDGSEAANTYATEHERLLFLMENGLATQEEVDEHFQSYIKRIMDTLKEYRDSIEENLRGSMNIFEKFNQNLMADGDDLLDNIESQIAGMTQWSDMLMELSKRSVDVNILKMLTDEGTSSFGKLKKMLSMTKEELALFNQRYKESEQAIRSARDTSLAALANATTFANQRAAAASKKLTKEQLAESARAAKRLISDARAVADNQARYRSFTKLEEKKYLATLTEEARKAYNKRLKDQKKYLKQEQKLAKKADTLRKQKKDIQDNVKSFDSLIKIYQKYQNSASAMVEINKQINESLKSVKDNIHDTNGYSADDMRWSWIKFAETLEDTGSGAENYFDELKARIETYVKSVRDAVNITQSLFEEFKTADKVSLDKMFGNAADNLSNMQDLADLTKKAGGMGLSADFWTYYKTKYIDSKDFAGAVAFLKEITSASKSEIDAMLGLIKKAQEASEAAAKALEDSQVSASGGAQLKVIQDAEDRLNRAKASLASTTASANKDITALNKEKTALENEMRNLERERVAAATIPNKNERAHVLQMLADAQQDALSKYNNITRLIAERQQSIAKATEEVNKSEKELSDALKKNAGSASATIQDATVKHFQSEYDKAVAAKNAAAKAAKDSQTNIDKAKKTKAEAEKALKNYKNKSKSFISPYKDEKAAKKALDDAKKIIDTETKKIKALTDAELAEAEAKRRLADAQTTANKTLTNEEAAAAREKNLQTWLKSIKSLDLLNAALKKVSKTSEEYGRIQKALKESLSGIKGAIDQYGSRWLNIANLSDTVSTNLDNISTAFLEFAENLGGSDDDSKSWFENMGQRLAEYRDSLDSTIRSQINLFDEFKKFSGNKGTTASKYLDNMSSQINGLEEWLTNLELLAKKGVSKDIIQMFASEGISSFEKVAAFVQASESEVGELNSRMKQYQDLVAEAADRAMATVGYSYTESAKNLQDKLMKEFEDSGVQRIKEAAEDGSKMLITGIKDGVTNAMPEIIGAVANTAKAVTNAIANEINTAPLMNAISSGLTSANATLNVANISGNAINGFYDTVTEEAITKFKMAVDSINEYINMNLQTEYTITVHVDTSEIDEAVARMNNAIGNTRIHANDASNAYVQSYQAPTPTAVFGAPAPSVTNNITYEQNNYSPKALSRTEIYRQTQNQLSTISDVVASASGG